jgi:hypothetical protein
MSKNKTMTWADIQAFLSECSLEEQMRLAEIKGVTVPPEVRAQAAAQSALGSIELHYGNKSDPSKVYLTFTTGCPSGGVTPRGTVRTGRAVYLTLQTLEAEIARLTAAQEALSKAGFPTKPSEAPVPGPEAARASGFRVVDKRG